MLNLKIRHFRFDEVGGRHNWLLFAYVVLTLTEGLVKKFMFPGIGNALLLLKFFPLGLFLALNLRLWHKLAPIKYSGLLYLIAVYFISLCFIKTIIISDMRYLLLATYAAIGYIFLPATAYSFSMLSPNAFRRLSFVMFGFLFLNFLISALQFKSPPGSFINSGVTIDEASVYGSFRAVTGVVRPSGLFTTSLANNFYTVICAVLAMYYLSKKDAPLKHRAIYVSVLLLSLSLVAISGSRFLVLSASISAFVYLLASKQQLKNWIWLIVLAGVVAIVFGDGISVIVDRFKLASVAESDQFEYGLLSRALRFTWAFIPYVFVTPFFGYYPGIASNASRQFNWVELPAEARNWTGYGTWGTEAPFADHLIDIGYIGALLFIALRVSIVVFLIKISLSEYRRRLPHCAALLAPFLLTGIAGQIATNSNVAVFYWFAVGTIIVMARKSGHAV